MSTFKGNVALLLDTGSELTAVAVLDKDEAGSWSGSLTFPANARTPELMNLATGQLRIDEQEGAFVRPDASDWVNSPTGLFRIRVEGNGDAPF